MEITLNNVKSLDYLKGIIATKYPSVKMHSDYLSLKYQGVKLTIEPKGNGIFDINKDVPILKGLLLAVVIIVTLYGVAALIYPPALARTDFLIFIGAFIFVTIAGIFHQKTKPVVAKFCKELVDMCNSNVIAENLDDSTTHSEQECVQKRVWTRNIIVALIAAIVFVIIHYSMSFDDGEYMDNGLFLVFSALCVLYSVYLSIKLFLLKRKQN